jgi:potassium efflux system protein
MAQRLFTTLLCFLFSTLIHSTELTTDTPVFDVKLANQSFDKINLQLSTQNLKLSALNAAVRSLTKLTADADLCIEDAQKKIDGLDVLIKQGSKATNEANSADLVYLDKQQKKWSNTQAHCRLFTIRANEAIEAYKHTASQLKEEATFARGMSLSALYQAVMDAPEPRISTPIIDDALPLEVITPSTWIKASGVALLLASALLFWLKKSNFSNQQLHFKHLRARHAVVFTLCILSGMLYTDIFSTHLLTGNAQEMLALTRLIFLYFSAWTGLIFFFKINKVRALFYWYAIDFPLIRFSLFFFLTACVVARIGKWLYATQALSTPVWQLSQTLYVLLLLCISFCLVIYTCHLNKHLTFIKRHRPSVLAFTAALLLIPFIAAVLGYLSLSLQLTYAGFILLMIVFITAMLIHGIEKLYQLVQVDSPFKTRVMTYFGYKQDQTLIEFFLLKIVIQCTLFLSGLFLFAKFTGFSTLSTDFAFDQFINGIHISNMTIYPSRLLMGVIIFCVIYLISRAISAHIGGNQTFDDEEETQVAVVSILTYVGFTVAVVIGSLIAGFNFTGLAIIAGALSVGIGLGLQSIVNNFVSGLILLIEKPIKPGDRIKIDNIEGFVKKIHIRSTQLITPSREDIIIPNSDLITRQVTNFMLTDKFCRISFPIGVAYGSDTELVRDTLLEIADHHEEVIKSQRNKPTVLFHAFGESELIFQLSCLIKDVNKKSQVQSDLHFDIERVFRERDIHMPFPQRELHIKLDSNDSALLCKKADAARGKKS